MIQGHLWAYKFKAGEINEDYQQARPLYQAVRRAESYAAPH